MFLGVVRLAPNVALRGTATQSTTPSSNYAANKAIDGNFGTSYCSQTDSSKPVWWQVDLLEVQEITKVATTVGTNAYSKCSCKLLKLFIVLYCVFIKFSRFRFTDSKKFLH